MGVDMTMSYLLRLTLKVYNDDIKEFKKVFSGNCCKRFQGEISNPPSDHFETIAIDLDSMITKAELMPLDFETVYSEEN